MSRHAPLNGLLIYNPPAGAGDNPRIGFDLDEPNAPARVQSGEPGSAVLKGQPPRTWRLGDPRHPPS